MDDKKRERLEAAGWTVGSVAEFLDLTPEEAVLIETKLQLGAQLKRRREELELSQTELAKIVNSSQSRVAKMEKGDPSVSLDLLFRTLYAVGTDPSVIGDTVTSAGSKATTSRKSTSATKKTSPVRAVEKT